MEALKETVSNLVDRVSGSGTQPGAPPRQPSSKEVKDLQAKYEKANQGQVFAFYESLDSTEQAKLFQQLAGFKPDHINELTAKVLHPVEDKSTGETKLEPLPASATCSVLDSKAEDLERWYEQGLDYIAENKVAVVLMAGGQGTRLGSSAPKGCYDIGLPSKKSLFQLQAERIRRVQSLAENKHKKSKVVVPWYVMTSGPTRGPTEAFFKEHSYFGLKAENVFVFEQGVLPCISNDGKILLESKSKVRSPRHSQKFGVFD